MKKIVLTVLAVLILMPLQIGAQSGGGDVTMPSDFGNVVFSHDKHAAKGLTCQQCHPELFQMTKDNKAVTMKEMEAGLSCGKCHNGNPVFSVKGDCFTCHAKKE